MKRLPSNAAASLLKAMANAGKGPLEPPAFAKLRDGDRPFWDSIIGARARDEWTEADLVVAVQLARCMADIERESVLLDAESSVVENARGTVVVNARVSVLEQFARREMALMRSLRMGGVPAGVPRYEAGARAAERQAKETRDEVQAEDELIAT